MAKSYVKSMIVAIQIAWLIAWFGYDLQAHQRATYWYIVFLVLGAVGLVIIIYKHTLKQELTQLQERKDQIDIRHQAMRQAIEREQERLERQLKAKGIHLSKPEIENELLK
jgi:high-affinity Fe2+/Pb2+ permease